jgi:hypothetical protein
VQHNDDQLKRAWQTYHYEFGFNVIPTGHNKIYTLALGAQLDPNLRVKLADYLQVAPAQTLGALRGYLKLPTFSSEIRRLLGTFFPQFSERGVNAITTLASVTGSRKGEDRNSYVHFYDQRISDETAQKLIEVYGDMASGIALLLREEDNLVVIDFDDRKALIDLLKQLGHPCDETNLEQTLQHVFAQNPIVETYRGYHIYCYDAEIAEIVKTTRKLDNIDIKVSRSYILLPPSLAGFTPVGATLQPKHYRFVRPMLVENIRQPLPQQVKDYILKQLRPQASTYALSFAQTLQGAMSSDLKSFVVDTLVNYWKRGVRDELTYTLAGVLRRGGVTLNDALDTIANICDRAGDEEKQDRLYQVRRQYLLPFRPQRAKRGFCAGTKKFAEACAKAGIPRQVYELLVNRIYGFNLTADITSQLDDHAYIASRIQSIIQNDIVYHKRHGRWFVFRDEERRWVEVKKEEALHEIIEAAYEVRQDLEETIKLLHDGSIPKQYLKPLNRLINKQFLTNSVMTYIEANLSVDFDFPRIPDDIKASLPAEVTRITSHRNGVLLWLRNGDTVFFPYNSEKPEGDPHRRFYITYTADSVVDENADFQPYLNLIKEMVDGKENAEYLLQHLATVLGLGKNVNHKFLLFIGEGRNGKNSFIQILEATFENFVRYTSSEILTASRFDNTINSMLAQLKGCAFAVIDEAPDPAKWNVETVKRLTGGDKTPARQLYHDVETIPITWVFIILTNDYPKQFKRQSQGLAYRIVAIKFPMTYSDNVINEGRFIKRRNPDIIEYFKQNTQIVIQAMRWAFKQAAQKNFVLTEPEKVSEFTREIKMKADSVSYFLSEYTVDDASHVISLQDLYQAYKRFVEERGIGTPLPDNIFAMRLYTKNIEHERRNGRSYIIGLRLKEDTLFEPASILSGNGQDLPSDNDDGHDYTEDGFPF